MTALKPPWQNALADLAAKLATASLIVFDFDGVIADSEVISLSTLRETFADYGITLSLDAVRDGFLGASLGTITAFVKTHHLEAGLAFDPDKFARDWEVSLFAAFRAGLRPMPSLPALLDVLQQRRLPYCIASSSTHTRLGVALAAMHLTERFEHIFSAQDVTRGKPAPDLFLYAAERMQTDPSCSLVIEDSPFGILGATAAGMPSIGFLGGDHLRDIRDSHETLLKDAGARWIVSSHDALIHLLRGGEI